MAALTESEFEIVRDLIESNFGVTVSTKSKSYFIGRLQAILYENGFSNYMIRIIDTSNPAYIVRD